MFHLKCARCAQAARSGEKGTILMVHPFSTPDNWPYKEQTRFKHDLLSNYMTLWARILGRPHGGRKRTLHYVDCFAASGRYSTGNLGLTDEPGSPIIAMEIGQDLHERHKDCFLECHFVEKDLATYNMLRFEAETAGVDFPDVWWRTHHGRFEDKLDEIFAGIDEGEPTLVFLDPYRILELDPIIRLLARRRNEILVTFMSSFTNRFLGSRAQELTWDTKFRSDAWRKLLGSPNRQEEIVRFYGNEIQEQARSELGLEDVLVYPIPVQSAGRKANIYHLIHISRHPKARHAMEQARASTTLLRQDSLPLFIHEVEEKVLEVLEKRKGLPALTLAGWVWRDNWEVSWKDIKGAIVSLESSRVVQVEPRPRRNRRTGLTEQDLVLLRES